MNTVTAGVSVFLLGMTALMVFMFQSSNDLPAASLQKGQASEEYKGATYYPDRKLYDFVTYEINGRFGWGITKSQIQTLYNRFAGTEAHCEVGLATPSLVAGAVPQSAAVLIVDVDSDFLTKAEKTLKELGYGSIKKVTHDITTPFEGRMDAKYEAIGLNFVLHCVPGTLSPSSKGVCFQHLKAVLAPGGVLFGSTVLGYSAGHNMFGSFIMKKYNDPSIGIFRNGDDDLRDIRAALARAFKRFEVKMYGRVVVYAATDDPDKDLNMFDPMELCPRQSTWA